LNAPGRRLRAATGEDLPVVEALLEGSGLPKEGVRDLAGAGLTVAEAPDGLLGCAALEVHGLHGLLRSVAVHPVRRGHGVGEALVLDRVRAARELRLEAIWLLTTGAADWFARFGFGRVERDAVPPEIRASWEFSVHCPAEAIVMSLPLVSPVVFVLVKPQFAGNLGMVCRAATAFGFPEIRVVQPVLDLAKPEARWFAHGAEQTLDSVRVFDSLDAALFDCHRAVATTARRRHWNRAMHDPQDLGSLFREVSETRRLAIVLGPEDDGLANEDVARCDAILSIPRPVAMGASLSLPAAATVVAWEIAKARGAALGPAPGRGEAFVRSKRPLATSELSGFVETVAAALEGIGLRPQPDALRFRGTLRDFFARAHPTEADRVFLRHLFAQLGKWKRRVVEEARREADGSAHAPGVRGRR
jgi:TrmH family RNA methyltransferase